MASLDVIVYRGKKNNTDTCLRGYCSIISFLQIYVIDATAYRWNTAALVHCRELVPLTGFGDIAKLR